MNDVERYELCIRCRFEMLIGYDWPDRKHLDEETEEAVRDMKKQIKANRKWINVWIPGYDQLLCDPCPYVLEHFVLSNGAVKTTDNE